MDLHPDMDRIHGEVVGRRFYETVIEEDEDEVRIELIFNILRRFGLKLVDITEVIQVRTQSCTDRETLLKLGLWDVVYDKGTSQNYRD